MIFRTGSCLVVGNCDEKPLHYVYEFIKKILENEYSNILIKGVEDFYIHVPMHDTYCTLWYFPSMKKASDNSSFIPCKLNSVMINYLALN